MTKVRVLHFTLGPVQSFVAQARRTRDLWAGSFLLSWLAGQGMLAIKQGGHGEISVPAVEEDQLFKALQKPGSAALWPRIGSLPNRFSAEITTPDIDPGRLCQKAIQTKWKELADLVWETFVKGVSGEGCEAEAIWNRQIESFWDMAWVVGERKDNEDAKWLDRRKNWRSHWPKEEPGDHCMLMHDWQELSGFVRAREHRRQQEFWIALRRHISQRLYANASDGTALELGKGERLCAIALVKRLFPVLFSERMDKTVTDKAQRIIGFIPSGLEPNRSREAHGEAARQWRSTGHIAATPWLRRIARNHPDACDAYIRAVEGVAKRERAGGVIFTERPESVPSLAEKHKAPRLAAIDGALFYHDYLLHKSDRALGAPLGSEDPDDTAAQARGRQIRAELSRLLTVLQDAAKPSGSRRQAKGREASPFFAVLLMDGDSMGKLIGELGGENLSRALAEFTKSAAAFKGDHVTIYAGGDDYLGLFPLQDVIKAAIELRRGYIDAFNAHEKTEGQGTISAAIVFAPHDTPLTHVIQEAHKLLDDVAKDGNGRDSIAIQVFKSSGPMPIWVSRWGDAECAPLALATLVDDLAHEDEHASGYLYKLRQIYEDYYRDKPIDEAEEERLHKILLAERLVGRDAKDSRVRTEAERHVKAILGACLTAGDRQTDKGKLEMRTFSLSGALIARFLADNGFAPASDASGDGS